MKELTIEATIENITAVTEFVNELLEKSIVASIADDVRVSVSGKKVELIIEKQL